jgi:actin related protein 2/3 complex, subunit 1A/1B
VTGTLDEAKAGKSASSSKAAVVGGGRLNSAAFNTFRNADSRGIANTPAGTGETELGTIHQNTITSVRAYEGGSGAVTRVSTSGVDGKLVVWNVDSVTALAGKLGGTSI